MVKQNEKDKFLFSCLLKQKKDRKAKYHFFSISI